jgi:hypothetical protein
MEHMSILWILNISISTYYERSHHADTKFTDGLSASFLGHCLVWITLLHKLVEMSFSLFSYTHCI